MSKLHFDFVKDQKQGIVELDIFTRLLKGEIYDTEELRKDVSSYANGYEYLAVAPINSLTSMSVWNCIRCTWNNYKKIRIQFRENISWDNRTIGWN